MQRDRSQKVSGVSGQILGYSDARYAAKTLRTMNHKFAGRSASRRTNHGYQYLP
jgi:hypothetical protein